MSCPKAVKLAETERVLKSLRKGGRAELVRVDSGDGKGTTDRIGI